MNKGIGEKFRAAFRIGTKMPTRYPCRCRACGRRRNLLRMPEQYTRPLKCRCGARDDWRVDWYRMAAEWGQTSCRCLEYSFPHARGHGYCEHNPRIALEDRQERFELRKFA